VSIMAGREAAEHKAAASAGIVSRERLSPPRIRADSIVKRYGSSHALVGLSLSVRKGERMALLGANGAGKTTLIRILALLTRPDLGSVEIDGLDASTHAQQIRSRIGVCLHDSLLYSELTVGENLRFFGRLYGVSNLEERMQSGLEQFDLVRSAAVRVRHLSRGQRQRTSLARALIHDPPVLLLDEPDTGQDLASLDRITAALSADTNRTIVFATHQPDLALALGTSVAILERGRARGLGATAALTPNALELELRRTSGRSSRT
jgi:heme exporter protein A